MAEQLTLYGTMLELRLQEEHLCRGRVEAAEQKLTQIREQIDGLDLAADNIARAARLAFADHGADQGRGYLRMKHKLRLDRALASSQMSAAKDFLRETRHAFTQAVGCRRELEKTNTVPALQSGFYREQLIRPANTHGMAAAV